MPTEQDPTMKVFMDLIVLGCPFCFCPLKPLVYKCKEGHLACANCHSKRSQKCECGGGFDVHNTAMGVILCSARVKCRHEGCGLYIIYHKLDDHQSACPFAPGKCLMPGCGYEGSPLVLPHHLSTVHLMPMHKIQYDKVLQLQMPVSEPRRLLFTEEDGHAFLVVGDALGIGAPITVSFICIRAGLSPPLHYAAKVWANGPSGASNGKTDAVKVEIEVTSSKQPNAIAVEELTSLVVPPKLLGGAGSSWTVSLHIHKLTS